MAKKSHIFAHLFGNENWKALSTDNCIEIIDSASSQFRLKLKEAIHIVWKKPSLNKQLKHVSITIIFYPSFIFPFYFYFFSLFWTFDLVSTCILNPIYNHSNFVKYYFIRKCLIDTFIETFNNFKASN